MAKSNFSAKKIKTGLLSAKDIAKGFTKMASTTSNIWTLAPIQCLPLEEKDEDWIKWNADWWENVALRELPKKAARYQKLYNISVGVINKSDYIYNPSQNDLSAHLGIIGAKDTEQSLFEQFFPIAPNILNLFLGEKIKRDDRIIVEAKDPDSKSEVEEFRTSTLKKIFIDAAMQAKQIELMKQGIIPTNNPKDIVTQQYQQEITTAQQLAEAQEKFKTFRTQGEQWGQHFVEKFSSRYYFPERELEMFTDRLVVAESIIALNLRENDFEPEELRPISTYVNMSPNQKYYSKSNGVVNIEFMTIVDIINKFRNDLTAEQIEKLENQYLKGFTENIMFADQVGQYSSSAYYDTSKSYDANMALGANMKEHLSDKAVENFLMNLNGNPYISNYSGSFNDTKLIRVSRIWWPSQRKVGELTTIDDTGTPVKTLVDENFLVTEKPVYDNSLLKEKTARTLISGEHIDWGYAVEWRYVVKIGENRPIFTITPNTEFEAIYLYGEAVRFQFKGDGNIYDAKPPIEGCKFGNKNTMNVSPIEKIKPWQIIYNVLNNKGAKVLPFDYGKVLLANKSSVPRNSLYQEDSVEPLFDMLDSIRDNKVLLNNDSREDAASTTGRQVEPRVLDMSTIEQASLYFQLAQFVKAQAFESIGVSQQRLGEIGKSESATGVQQSEAGSVNQTEMLFNDFSGEFMPRVWQMILEAGQYYSVKSEEFSDSYLNSENDRAFFSVAKTDLLLRDLFIKAESSASVRELMKNLKQLAMQDNTMGATLLDKIKIFKSTVPSELMEELQEAEAQRQEQEQQKHDNDMQLQKQQNDFLQKQQQAQQQLQEQQFYDKLKNERYIAELAVEQPVTTPPVNPLDQQKLALQGQQQSDQNQLAQSKLDQDSKNNQDKNDLEREKMQVEREKMQSNENIAIQNKNVADLKFAQAQRNKNRTK